MYGWGLLLLKNPKFGTAKVWLGSYSIEIANIRYGWSFNLFKMLE